MKITALLIIVPIVHGLWTPDPRSTVAAKAILNTGAGTQSNLAYDCKKPCVKRWSSSAMKTFGDQKTRLIDLLQQITVSTAYTGRPGEDKVFTLETAGKVDDAFRNWLIEAERGNGAASEQALLDAIAQLPRNTMEPHLEAFLDYVEEEAMHQMDCCIGDIEHEL